MRNLFFLLLVLNLGFLLITQWPPRTVRSTPPQRATPSVPLLELAVPAAAAAPAGTGAPTTVIGSAVGGRCRSIGPFADGFAAAVAADALKSHGLQPRDRSADTSVGDGYWVYIGELTAAAQRGVLAKLNAAGIHDAAPMTQPEDSDRVSVGVFADQMHAVRRAEQVRALGYKPVLDLHQHTVSMHWLDVDLMPGDPDLQPRQIQNSTSLQVTDCPARAPAG